MSSVESVGRSGADLVVPRNATLPPFCVKCGAAARPEPLRSTFHWHDPLLYLTILAGCVVYFVVALIVRKRFELLVPLCETHFHKRRLWRLVGAVLLIGAFPAMAAGVLFEQPAWGLLMGVVGLLAGVLVFGTAGSTLKVARITDRFAVFRGADETFLRLVPPIPLR